MALPENLEIDGHKQDGPQSLRVYNRLRQAILTSELEPGFPLQEIEISERLGVSRTPVREAIRRLSADGLVEIIPYKGAFVKALSRHEIREIYETAEALESMAAKLAALRATADGIAELEGCVQAMRAAFDAGDREAMVEADAAYHVALHAMAGNAYLVQSLSRLHEQVHRVRHLTVRAFSAKPTSIDEHEQMCRAIAGGDPERARLITQKHWERVREEMLSLLP